MKEMYALSGKKSLFLLLNYQLIFLTSVLVWSSTIFCSFFYGYHIPTAYKVIIFTIASSSLALLVDGLWEALSGAILRLDYMKSRLIRCWIFRPILIISILTFIIISNKISISYTIDSVFSQVYLYIFFLSLSLAVFVNLLFVVVVLKDIFLSKSVYQKYSETLSLLAQKYGKKSIDRALLSLNLANNKAKGNPLPSHNGFTFVGLTSLPWHEPKKISWVNALEINYRDIKEEALNIMAKKQDLKPHYLNYSGIVKGRWNSIMLIQGGKKESVCAHCPKTMNLLKLASERFRFREVMFSILEPGAVIKPHRDYSNTYLTYHLGLLVPPQSGIIVGGIERKWEEGKSLILDTSYEHEAWNNSDQIRLILLVDFFHPELTEAEQDFISLA